jgi:eukaryotic-like serine/threonine-protein kinase
VTLEIFVWGTQPAFGALQPSRFRARSQRAFRWRGAPSGAIFRRAMTDDLARLRDALADRYRVDREIGAGGMATVYLAEDLKHHRPVAIKVLRPELAEVLGADRFVREVNTTAQLHHPHILALFDSGQADGFLYYVMPYVTGESLRARLAREKQLPVEDALRIAREAADALSYAHAHGVIHRDIKPENILLDSGHALVADFGVALAVQTAGGERMTQTGVSMGTPQYMSPEQMTAERDIDARSDIYALGAVTYEMLTGDPPFRGATTQAILARALTEHPTAPSVLRSTVPPALDAAVFKAMARAPADRFMTAAAFGEALGAVGTPNPVQLPRVRVRGRGPSIVVAAGSLVAAAAIFYAGRAVGRAGAVPIMRFDAATRVTWEPGLEIAPDLSPDGRTVAYAAGDGTRFRIFVRPVTGGRPTPLTDDTTMVETMPQWSPDGSRILFIGNGLVYSAPSGGGPAREEVPPRSSLVETAAWAPDGRAIVYAVEDSIFIRDATGASRFLASITLPGMCSWGKAGLIACVGGNGWYFRPGMAFSNLSSSWIAVIDPATGRVAAATDTSASVLSPQWTGDGRTLLFISAAKGPRDIYALRLTRRGTADGPPRRITVGLDASSMALAADGSRLTYAVMHASSNIWSQPWSEAAPTVSLPRTQLTFGEHTIEGLAVSRDQRWLYYDSDASGNSDIYRMRLPAGQPERLTTDPAPEFNPMPSPDGREVAFQRLVSTRDIFIMPLDGGPVVQVTDSPMQEQFPAWSPDGQSLAAASQSTPYGLVVIHRLADGGWTEESRVPVGHWPSWSPDGRSLSYATELLGGWLRVIPVDSGPSRALYDTTAPDAPLAETSQWSADGRTIYFKAHDADGQGWLWSVTSVEGVPRRLLRLGDDRLRSDRFGFRIAGDRLYYGLYDRQGDIWVMDIAR